MKTSVKYIIMLISLCAAALFPHMEINASELSKSLQTKGSFANKNYTFTTINDTAVSTISKDSNVTVLIFGRVGCGNTRAVTKNISQSPWVKDKNIRIMLATIDNVSKEETSSFANTYGCPSMIFCYDTTGKINSAMWDYLYSYGNTNSVILPVAVLIDNNNMVQNIMTGYHTADEVAAEINRIKKAETSAGTNTGTKPNTGANTGTTAGSGTEKPKPPVIRVRKKNEIVTDKKTKAKYKITAINKNGGSVEYRGMLNKKKTFAEIPAAIKIDGKTYKVTGIAANAFKGNKKLKSITIGKNVKSIGKRAFNGCKNLKKIVVKSSALTKKRVGAQAFKGIHPKAKIKVPKSKVKVYKKMLKSKGIGKRVKVM